MPSSKLSPTNLLNRSSAFASTLISILPMSHTARTTKSQFRVSPPKGSNRTATSGSPSHSLTLPSLSEEFTRAKNSSGAEIPPTAGNQAFANSFALRPSTHCFCPFFGGAKLNQSSTERISRPFLITFIYRFLLIRLARQRRRAIMGSMSQHPIFMCAAHRLNETASCCMFMRAQKLHKILYYRWIFEYRRVSRSTGIYAFNFSH